MSQPFVGEIRIFAGNFAPQGWSFCNGALLSIAQNETLYTLLGTTYGGDGVETFQLPDLRGRVPIHAGGAFVRGEFGGSESVLLTSAQLPAHTHPIATSASGTSMDPANNLIGPTPSATPLYLTPPGTGALAAAGSIGSFGGAAAPHENMMPFQCVNYIISLFGIYPSQN